MDIRRYRRNQTPWYFSYFYVVNVTSNVFKQWWRLKKKRMQRKLKINTNPKSLFNFVSFFWRGEEGFIPFWQWICFCCVCRVFELKKKKKKKSHSAMDHIRRFRVFHSNPCFSIFDTIENINYVVASTQTELHSVTKLIWRSALQLNESWMKMMNMICLILRKNLIKKNKKKKKQIFFLEGTKKGVWRCVISSLNIGILMIP